VHRGLDTRMLTDVLDQLADIDRRLSELRGHL
jgi:hypothetical protein